MFFAYYLVVGGVGVVVFVVVVVYFVFVLVLLMLCWLRDVAVGGGCHRSMLCWLNCHVPSC